MSEHNSDQEVLRLDGLCKRYNAGQPTETQVLHGLSLRLQRSDFTALTGSSGSGKSTLLNLIGLLDTPTAGELCLLGQPTSGMDEAQRTALRGQHIGFVFQFHHLITAFTALENVLMPIALAHGKPTREHTEFAQHLLAQVGLEKLAQQRPDQLSGGQQQRVAVARALAHSPKLVIADEPTGNIDPELSLEMMELLERVSQTGITVLVVTHEHELVHRFHQRVVTLKNGRIISDIPADPEAIAARSAELNAWKELTEPVDDEPDEQNDETKEKEAATV